MRVSSETAVYDPLVDTRMGGIPRWYLSPRVDIHMRISDDVRKCVAFVGLPHSLLNGQQTLVFKGTAFFVSIPSSAKGTVYVYLVTAKHVAEKLEGKPFFLRLNTRDGTSALISGEGARWWTHPTDDSVDVAVIPYAPPLTVDYTHVESSVFLSDEIIEKKGIGSGDEVFIAGLFAHLSGSKRNLPIVRMGNIAMVPDEKVPTKDYGEVDAYLIEARSIGGLSGSPVFVRETVPLGLGPFYLLGLMHGHWDIPPSARNDAVRSDDAFGRVNMGIAVVIPAKKILEVLNHPELVEMRRRHDEELLRQQATPKPDEKVINQKQT